MQSRLRRARRRCGGAGAALALALVLALVSALPSASAGSALSTGAAAPAFEGKEFINTEEIGMNDLRGQVIFYEIFRSW
jgi:hypothetical protein